MTNTIKIQTYWLAYVTSDGGAPLTTDPTGDAKTWGGTERGTLESKASSGVEDLENMRNKTIVNET